MQAKDFIRYYILYIIIMILVIYHEDGVYFFDIYFCTILNPPVGSGEITGVLQCLVVCFLLHDEYLRTPSVSHMTILFSHVYK